MVAAADALAHALARRQLLLVLDNCEQVIGAAAEVCGRLLLGADDMRVLATSREPAPSGCSAWTPGPLLVLTGYAVLFGFLAMRFFRWE